MKLCSGDFEARSDLCSLFCQFVRSCVRPSVVRSCVRPAHIILLPANLYGLFLNHSRKEIPTKVTIEQFFGASITSVMNNGNNVPCLY